MLFLNLRLLLGLTGPLPPSVRTVVMNLLVSTKVWFRCLSTSLVFCLAVANAHSHAQQAIGESTLISVDMTELASADSPANTPAASPAPIHSDLPDAPSKAPPVPPAFDSLRLMGSGSLDDSEPEPEEPRLSFDVGTVYAVQNAVRSRLPSSRSKPHGDEAAELARQLDDEPWRYEKYHWDGLIAQSFFFNVFESAWRMASDNQIRFLVARKPFWRDYIASIHQFNMGRWNDGDDFLVNYIGHPLQGSVSSYIEIQNDPTGRQQEISATRDYWMSRFKGFLWATAFSVHSEISPLGEAGIGNEGGWTYPVNCHRPCARWNPKTMKSTNNTGWVDFIITPTVGTLWVLAEDTLDRFISDRVQGDRRTAPFPLILRGALSPSRTMANAMRLKAPWYRDFQHGLPERYDRAPLRRGSYGVHMLPDDETPPAALRRFSLSPHYRAMPLGSLNNPCAICMASHGVGFDVDYAINRWISASASLDKQDGLMTPKKLALREASSASDAT